MRKKRNHKDNIYVRPELDFKDLEGVLNNYLDVVENYSEIVKDDFCFAYTEGACVANLASAFIHQGWAALTEYQHTKIHKVKASQNSAGRNDLFVSDGDRGIYCEAKIGFLDASGEQDKWKGMVERTWQNAHKDMTLSITNRRSDNELGLAISFFCVSQQEFDEDKKDEKMNKIWEYCMLPDSDSEFKNEVDAIAWYKVPEISEQWKPWYPVGHVVTVKSSKVPLR